MHYLLLIDTSTDTGTIALTGDGQLLASRSTGETRNHAGVINLMINDVLAEAKVGLAGLSAIAVCAGPGSYTGLRIGVATAKGFCYALNKPLILNNRLTLLAWQAFQLHQKQYDHYIPLLVAREKEYFIAIYDSNFNCLCEPKHIDETELNTLIEKKQNAILLTDATALSENPIFDGLTISHDTKIAVEAWSIFAFEEYNCNRTVNLTYAEPFYLKQVYTHK